MRRAAILLLLAGCFSPEPTTEEIALKKYEEAEPLWAQGRYAECVERYEYVVKWRERWKEARLRLAECYDRTGRRDRAREVLEHHLKYIDPNDAEVRARLQRLSRP